MSRHTVQVTPSRGLYRHDVVRITSGPVPLAGTEVFSVDLVRTESRWYVTTRKREIVTTRFDRVRVRALQQIKLKQGKNYRDSIIQTRRDD